MLPRPVEIVLHNREDRKFANSAGIPVIGFSRATRCVDASMLQKLHRASRCIYVSASRVLVVLEPYVNGGLKVGHWAAQNQAT